MGMAGNSLKGKAVNGMFWTSMEKFGSQFIQLVIGIAIARVLSPSDYGVIGMTMIFMALANTFMDSGFGSAIIRKKDRTAEDYATCFYFNIVVSVILYILFFACSPYIARFYHAPILTPVCRVLGLCFIVNAMCMVQSTKLTAELKFKQLSIITVSTGVLSGVFGLILAYTGFGVWALVFQSLFSCILRFILVEYYTRWRPLLLFSMKSFNYLFSFGSKFLCSSIINIIYNNLYTLVIGRVYAPLEVGYYNRALHFAYMPSQSILDTVMKVVYPVMSEVQDDQERLKRTYQKFLRIPLFILYPILAGMIALAHPFIYVVLGEKWLPCVPYLQILALGAMFSPLTHINLNILYVKGRTDLVLKLEIVKKTIAFAILFSMIKFGIVWLIIGKAFYELVAYSFNCYYTGKLINFGFWKQMYYNIPIIFKSSIMGIACYLTTILVEPAWLKVLLGGIVGLFVYGTLVIVTKDESLKDIIEILKMKKGR
ncbi:lipopolysaccharide biosynthesis protein [Prevotella sp. PINT]|jgi:Membrane protein involved in the export of O-antigen and teichoic acid|uniref:lipopolysaccharide biosynthesis protein n=1 Tax=Palleniella intestinalis TaxID=2736291 RepID=UPI001555E086|nr:lipopolysaccharide biosynthesis protein [Palleniella intestinalis]NPD82451.1 lipopolysaccharide biosynthesis protein [Palleniella intestinalis]